MWSSKQAHSQQPSAQISAKAYPRMQIASLIALAAISGVLLFWKLGAASLNDWDEAIYAQVAKEIVNGGDWLTLHWGYTPWFHKPPLFMWVTAFFFQVFDVSEFWARAASALAGFGLVGCTYLIARRLYNHYAGLLTVVVLLTNYTFIHFSRFGTTDVALTLFIYIAIYAYISMHQGNQRAWLGIWSAIAGAFMVKGVAGLSVAIAIALTLLLTNRYRQALRSRPFWLGFGIALLIVLPWHCAMLAIHGQAFIDQYFLYHVVARSTGGLEGNEGGIFFYVDTLAQRFFPWIYLLPIALFQQLKQPRKYMQSPGFVLLVLVAVVFGGFSLAGTKLSWYIIPIYPALAIWIGHLLWDAIATQKKTPLIGMLIGGAIVMALFPPRVVFLSATLQQLFTLAGFLGLLLLSFAVFKLGWSRQLMIFALCGLFLVAGLREIKGEYQGFTRPVAKLATVAATEPSADNAPLLVAKLSANIYVPTPLFYSNRPIAWARTPEEIAELTTDQAQDILLGTKDIESLSKNYSINVLDSTGKFTYAKIKKQ